MIAVGSTTVTTSAVDLQLISVPSASPGSPSEEQVRTQIKTPLPKAGGDAEAQLGGLVELSLVPEPLELQEDCHPCQKIHMARNICFGLILNPSVFFITAVDCGFLRYLDSTRVSQMSVSLALPFPFCLATLRVLCYKHPRMMFKSK